MPSPWLRAVLVAAATWGHAARESITFPVARKPLERSFGLVVKRAVCEKQKGLVYHRMFPVDTNVKLNLEED